MRFYLVGRGIGLLMKRYQTFEWIKMPQPLQEEFSEEYEHRFGHYTYIEWYLDDRWGSDTEEGQAFHRTVSQWLWTQGLEFETDGTIPESVLILVDW